MSRKNRSRFITGTIILLLCSIFFASDNAYALGLNVSLPGISANVSVPIVNVTVPPITVSTPVVTVSTGNTTPQSPTNTNNNDPLLQLSVPSLVTNLLNINSSSTNQSLLNQNIVGQLLSASIINDPQWQSATSSSPVQVYLSQNTGSPELDGSQFISTNQVIQGATGLAYHSYDDLKDWSGFTKIGFWVLSDIACKAGDAQFILSSTKDLASSTENLVYNLPALPAKQWVYVNLDLKPSQVLKKIGSYGFSLSKNNLVSLHVRPFELGPGILHHFKIQANINGKKDLIKIIAEDKNGLALNAGVNLYNGVKKLIFKRSTTTIQANVPVIQTSAAINFTNGSSDPISISAVAPGMALNDLDLTDGVVNTAFGDFSYNLGAQSSSVSTTSIDHKMSMISVAPNPAIVGKPALVTLTIRDINGNTIAIPGLTTRAEINGANSQLLALTDNSDGSYEGSYIPTKSGTDAIKGLVNGNYVGSDTDGTSDGTFNARVLQSTTDTGNGGGGTGSNSSGSGSTYFGGGAGYIGLTGSSSCSPYLSKYIKRGENNDPAEVMKLQMFLRDKEAMTNVKITGVYDLVTFNAVKTFQNKYVKDVLNPWSSAVPTGYVYIKTLAKINDIQCRGSVAQIAQTSSLVNPTSCRVFTESQWLGKSGADVTKIQQFLVNNSLMAAPSSWGYYGTVTQNAVKKFQKEYESEILLPVNQTIPTGRWLSLTMKKANQLMGCSQ